jgi:ribosomal protein L7/L12
VDITLLWLVIALLILGIVVGASRVSGTTSLERRLARVERKLDLVLDHLGVHEPASDLAVELDALLGQGKKIAAIKRYREITGAGLKEAKDEVDRISRETIR